MSRLDSVIETVKEYRKPHVNRAWIYNDNGEIRDDVIVADIIPFLEELKDFEISISDKWIEKFVDEDADNGFNTYNWGANISNDIDVRYRKCGDAYIMVIMVHLCGDIRCNYTEWFACKFDYIEEFFELESATQYISINDRYSADVSIFSEGYNVYDYENGEDVGEFYDIEKSDLLKSINENS